MNSQSLPPDPNPGSDQSPDQSHSWRIIYGLVILALALEVIGFYAFMRCFS